MITLFLDLEVEASVSVVDKILKKHMEFYVQFHICKLKDVITETCLAPLEKVHEYSNCLFLVDNTYTYFLLTLHFFTEFSLYLSTYYINFHSYH